MQYDIVIHNCALFDAEYALVTGCCVGISQGKIQTITTHGAGLRGQEEIQAQGKLLLPGFVDAHTHVCQQLLRGRTTDEYPMIWTRFLVPFESSLTPQDVRISTQLACLEMIKAGITSFADAGGVHMHEAAQVVAQSGMRAALCRSTMDIGANIPDSMKMSCDEHMRQTTELYNEWHGKAEGRVEIWFGLRQVMTCSSELVRSTAQQAKALNTGIHAHLCEHKDEVSFCLQNYRRRPAEFLDDCGALGPNLLTAHNVTLSESDISLLARREVKIIHCPQANLSYHGFPKTPRILEAGCTVGIGNDGASGVALDMFEQLRVLKNGTLAFWGLPVFDPVVLPTRTLLEMAAPGGAAALGKKTSLGRIEEGYTADVILLDTQQPHISPTQNMANTIVCCASGRDVTHSIINGRLVMRNRQVLTLDEEAVLEQSTRCMQNILQRAGL